MGKKNLRIEGFRCLLPHPHGRKVKKGDRGMVIAKPVMIKVRLIQPPEKSSYTLAFTSPSAFSHSNGHGVSFCANAVS